MHTTGERWRLGHRPALDGLRGVAVLLVLLAHSHVPGLENAGSVGVDVFFTLSGFLITSLLLEELRNCGRVSFVGFYQRRARRLLPALVVLVAAVTLFGLAAGLGAWWISPGQVAGALFYCTNVLRFGGPQGALSHTWSLSMEEQFYIVWPVALILLTRLGRRGVLVGSVAGAVVSIALGFALWGHVPYYRVVFGPDTRAFLMLLGCALAAVMHGSRVRAARPVAAGAAALLLLTLTVTQGAFAVLWMPLLASLLTCVIVASAAARDGRVAWLQWRPLTWVGKRSYGVYLWHYPVAVLADAAGVHSWLIHVAVVGGGGLLFAALSYRFIEQPAMRLRLRGSRSVGSIPAPIVLAATPVALTR